MFIFEFLKIGDGVVKSFRKSIFVASASHRLASVRQPGGLDFRVSDNRKCKFPVHLVAVWVSMTLMHSALILAMSQ